MIKLIRFLKPYKKECMIGPLFKLFEAVLELILPTIMALIINNGVQNKDLNYVLKMGGLMLFMAILGYSSSLVCQKFASVASQGVGTNLRNEMFEHITNLSDSEIDKFNTSSLINRVTNDVNQIQGAVAMLIRLVVRAPFICIGAIIMALILDAKLSIILIATTPIFAVILYYFISRTTPMYKIYQSKLDKLTQRLREDLLGVRVVRAFNCIGYEKKRFNKLNDNLTDSALGVSRVSALLNPLTQITMNFAIIILLWVSTVQIKSGNLSQGTIIAFINYITQILLASIVVSNLVILFVKAEASAIRINEVLETQTSIKYPDKLNQNQKNEKTIEFKNVSFKYNEDGDNALSDINMSIAKGSKIGIIGGTGSGKTSFINLIGRYYDVNNGEVLVDGINVKDYPLNQLRDKIGVAAQKIELFSGTIIDNIKFSNKFASLEEVVLAAKAAQADEFISKLEKGYDTPVLRGGANFSGGQKQRITIARALLKRPEILILDDSSSALDYATDANLQRDIREYSEDMTTIIVSQRISSINDCDKIIVFDDGIIDGIGTHEELLDSSAVYNQIYSSQNREV